MIRATLAATLLLSFVAFAPPAAHAAYAAHAADLPPGQDATVTRVVDGDTIQVSIAGKRFTLR